MYASEKYMLDVIKIECKKFLTVNINDDNACMVLQTAHSVHLEDLQKDALQYIFSHGKSCLESTSFVGLSSGYVKLIIASENLVCTEEIIYQNMIHWAQQQCRKEQHVTDNDEQHVTGNDQQHVTAYDEQHVTGNDEQHVTAIKEQHVTGNDEQHVTGNEEQHVTGNDEQHMTSIAEQHIIANDEQLRKVLGDLIYLIRFPIMKCKYFTNEVSTKNVLTAEEKVEIFQSFHDKPICTFPANMRLSMSKLEICRFEKYLDKSSTWTHGGTDDCLDFTTNFDCYIFGVTVFGSKQYSGQHEVNIDILNDYTILGSTSTKLYSVEGKELYPIDLAEPLRILKNIRYTIKLNMKGNSCFKGKNYRRVVKIDDDSSVTFTDSVASPNGTSSTQGQIPVIILSRPYLR
jgi:hypothetical protein